VQTTEALVEAGQLIHVVPHAPRLSLATHWLLQKFWPFGHWQVALTHCLPPVHAKAAPHPPQLFLSFEKLTHCDPHAV
jgi:hypothetical protein